MGGHQEDPLPTSLGEEGPGDSGGLSSGAADGGVGEDQRHHPSGGPGDHGPADGGVTQIPASHPQPPFFPSALRQTSRHTTHTALLCTSTQRPDEAHCVRGKEGGEEEREASKYRKILLNQLKREREHGVSFYVVSFDVWTVFVCKNTGHLLVYGLGRPHWLTWETDCQSSRFSYYMCII